MKMLDLNWVGRALPPLCRVVYLVGGEVQQGFTGGTSNWGGGVISGLPKRTSHRISSLMCNAPCNGRCGLLMIGEQEKSGGN